ncbi:Mov34/MPN/PAD-1 family protein [Hoeflea marina]|uniref:Mov34/MPN/PAD-1 family protein n=1 Tax=Hoeflea marina TaxID=274592 RepID=UPI003CC9CAC8
MANRQKGIFSRETGGQMFARLASGKWTIEVATGARPGDRRGRLHFWPDRKAEQDEINEFYRKGLDFVGDWHTHPEDIPRPSPQDSRSIENMVRQSVHELPGMLMCIVGRAEPPHGLWLSFHLRDGRVAAVGRPVVTEEKRSYRRRRFI